MNINIDTEAKTLHVDDDGNERRIDLYGKEAFELISGIWLKTSWNQKYPYTFTWCGRPIIQHPEDLVRLQEVVYALRPNVIIETGVAHGGSLVFFASLMKSIGHGHVVGVDIEIRPHNRAAIEAHTLAPMISLVEGDSTAPEIVEQATAGIKPNDVVLVVLDSDHSRVHVAKELEVYQRFVTPGSYIVATDGIMEILHDVPRGEPQWKDDNPAAAARDFVASHPEFVLETPPWVFNESQLDQLITGWPSAWLKRVHSGT
jgi:cephalosporin hydroxylase